MGHTLTIEPLGHSVEVEEGQTILEAALRSGVYLPHACCHGLCGTCKVQVTDGEVDHGAASSFALMDFEREEQKTLACCARLESDVTIEAEIDEEPDARNYPVRDYQGTISSIESVTPTIKQVRIQLDGELPFQAGQYVNLHLGDDEALTRAFSMGSAPRSPSVVELDIRRVPGGMATGYIHDRLKVGDSVRVAGPYGRFFVRKSARQPVLLMAGGSGLSAIRSMIADLLADEAEGTWDQPITLVYGQRTRAELYHHDALTALAQAHPRFTYLPALSEEEPGEPGIARGLVPDVASAHFGGDFRGHKAYLCGPPAMVESCIRALMKGRLFERDIFTERFLCAADAQQVRSPLFRSL